MKRVACGLSASSRGSFSAAGSPTLPMPKTWRLVSAWAGAASASTSAMAMRAVRATSVQRPGARGGAASGSWGDIRCIGMLGRGPEAISPTAHYTGAVWERHGLSDPAFATLEGRVLHDGLWPLLTTVRLAGGPSLEAFLLARHRIIDLLLETAIGDGRVGQVV